MTKNVPEGRWFGLPVRYNGFFSYIFSTTGKPRPNNGQVLRGDPKVSLSSVRKWETELESTLANLHSCQPIIGWIVRKVALCFWHGERQRKRCQLYICESGTT